MLVKEPKQEAIAREPEHPDDGQNTENTETEQH
jgi:hypothetical protein